MLNTKYERVIDIINKILENKVARLDDITTKNVTLLSAFMSNY